MRLMEKLVDLMPKPVRTVTVVLAAIGGLVYGTVMGLAWAEEATNKIVQAQVKAAVPAEVKKSTDAKFEDVKGDIASVKAEVKVQVSEVKQGQAKAYSFLKCALLVHASNGSAASMLACDKD